MLNAYRMKALEGLLDYLSGMQGGDLKALMDGSQKPMDGDPLQEAMESPKDEMNESPETEGMEDPSATEMPGKPKGIAIEKVSIMGKPKPGMEDLDVGKPKDEMNATDDELAELYKKFRK